MKVTIILHSNSKGAALNRMTLNKRALELNGVKVNVIHIINENIKFKFLKLIDVIIKLFRIKFLRTDKVFVYGHVPDIVFKLLKNTNFILERTEYPAQLISSKSSTKSHDLSFYKYASKFISCSDTLISYYSSYMNKECKYFKFPLIVDYEKFSNTNTASPLGDIKYVVYCGYMGNNKDGLHDLLEAFNIFSNNNKEIYLCLIGTAETEIMEELKDRVKKLGLEKRILFTGAIPHDDIPKYLCNAKVMLLSRPNNKQAEGGFPSKLGEYLSTGNPILVTHVGEIPNYIKNGINGYIVEPDNPKLFADKLQYIIDNYEEAKKIGIEGQKLAKIEFDYKGNYAQKLLNFITD